LRNLQCQLTNDPLLRIDIWHFSRSNYANRGQTTFSTEKLAQFIELPGNIVHPLFPGKIDMLEHNLYFLLCDCDLSLVNFVSESNSR